VRMLGFPSRALTSRWLLVAVFTAAGAALAGCGHGSASPAGATGTGPSTTAPMAMPPEAAGATDVPAAAPVATPAVTIDNFAFSPRAITVKAGTTVTWTNRDEEPHTVTAEDGSFKSGTLAGNTNTFSHTFTVPGSFTYHCSIHPYMTGTVEVTR
jgi:plastocyanin